MKRDRSSTIPFLVFLILIWGAVAVWLHVALTDARLSPRPSRWGPPFLVGGGAAVAVFILVSLVRSVRNLFRNKDDAR